MIVVNVWVESGCSFEKGEYRLDLEAVIQDCLSLRDDIDHIEECIREYDREIKSETLYTFFLHRANISTAFPGYEPAFCIHQVLENIPDVDIQI